MRLYIDPGTGSMLFAIVIGLVGVVLYFLRGLFVKLRFLITGGKAAASDSNSIPLVIFAEDKRYWSIFEPIIKELDKREFDVVYMTASKDDPSLTCEAYPHLSAQFIGEGNRAFAKLNFLKATILLSTTPGLDVYQWKRSKSVKYYVHIVHSPTAGITLYEVFGTDYYDALLLSSIHQEDDIRAIEKLRDLPPKELVFVGLPFMDEKLKRIAQFPTLDKHERTILLAPSWGPNSILNRFGDRMIRNLLDTGYHIIVRPHPQSFKSDPDMMEKLMTEFPENEQLEWNRDNDNLQVLARSDLMISDFSGVVYEFTMLFDRPVICAMTDFDTSKYDAWWLDSTIWTLEYIPKLGAIISDDDLEHIKTLIDNCIEDSKYSDARRDMRDKIWLHQGEGAKRVVDYLEKKYKELTESTEQENASDS